MEYTQPGVSLTETADQKWKGLYYFSGILMIVIPVLSFIAAWCARILYAPGYSDPASYLQLVSQHQGLASTAWGLWIVTDILGLAPAVAMYIVLQRHNRTLALLGTLLLLFYSIYDVSATELNSLTLVSLSHSYASATTDALRASFLAAATYGYYALPLQTVPSFAIGSVGYILWCVPMMRSFFGRWTATIGIVVSAIGLLGSAAPVVPSSILALCAFICVRAIAVWSVIVGVQLLLYARRVSANAARIEGSQ